MLRQTLTLREKSVVFAKSNRTPLRKVVQINPKSEISLPWGSTPSLQPDRDVISVIRRNFPDMLITRSTVTFIVLFRPRSLMGPPGLIKPVRMEGASAQYADCLAPFYLILPFLDWAATPLLPVVDVFVLDCCRKSPNWLWRLSTPNEKPDK